MNNYRSGKQVRMALNFGTLMIMIYSAFTWSCESDSSDPPPVPPPNLFDWAPQQSFTLEPLSDIYFVDNNFGWAVGGDLILATSDGGSSWQHAPFDPTTQPDHINSIHFINQQQGWFASGLAGEATGEIFISQQGGAYPVLQQSYDKPVNAIYFLDRQQGWAAGNTGIVVSTSDGGSTWESMADLGVDLFDIQFTTEQKGWFAGDNGSLFKTTDGINLQQENLGIDQRLNAIHFTDTLHGWVCGNRNTLFRRHLDSENKVVWSNAAVAEASEAAEWNDICFIDRFTGWVVGAEGVVYKTTDGGLSWERERIETFENLNAITMVSGSRGWIAGDEGLIFNYTPR